MDVETRALVRRRVSDERRHLAGAAFFDIEVWRVTVTFDYPDAPETWIYYRIEDWDNVELLWIIQPRSPLPPMVH